MIDSLLNIITTVFTPFFKIGIPILTIFLLYALFRLWVDNKELRKEIKIKDWLGFLGQTIYSWSFIGILITLGFTLNFYYGHKAEELIYKTGFVEDQCRDPITLAPCSKKRLQKNIINTSNKNINIAEYQAKQELIKIKQLENDDLVENAPYIAKESFLNSMPDKIPGLEPKNCKWYQVVCRVIESFKRGANRSYDKKRNNAANKLETATRDFIRKGRRTSEDVFEYSNNEISKLSNEFKENTEKTINTIFDFFYYSSIFNYIFLSLISLKTFLLVLGRVIFCDGKHPIRFSNKVETPDDDIRTFNGENSIELNFKDAQALYIHSKKNPSGCEPRVRFKQIHKLFFGRIPYLIGTKKVNLNIQDVNPELSQVGAKEFVVWKLNGNNTVIFNMKTLIAFSDQIKFKRKLSFKLSTLLFGTIFFPSATGSGYLIFQTKGEASKNSEKIACNAVDVSRHIAWDENTKFLAKVSLNPWDTLITGFNLEKHEYSPGAVDSDSDISTKNSIGRFLKYFLIPF